MSKRYSLFKGAGAASIRRLGVLLAMLLSTAWYSVSYADAGFYDLNAFDVKVKTSNDESYRWLYGSTGFDFSQTGANAGLSEAYDLGTLTSLYIDGYYTRVHRKSENGVQGNICESYMYYYLEGTEGDTPYIQGKFQKGDDSGNMPQVWGVDNKAVDLLDQLGISGRPGTYTVKYYFLSKGSATTGGCSEALHLSNNGSDYSITFTIPPVFNPSETTMYFGNVPYGESKESTVHFEYNGSYDLSGKSEQELNNAKILNIVNRPAWCKFVSIDNGSITYRYEPGEDNINMSRTHGEDYIELTVDGETFKCTFIGSTFTPLIAGSREPVRAQSIAELSGAIMYTGCNTIEEYGVYYSTDPGFFDSATNTVDMSKSQVANVTGVTIVDPDDPADPDDDLKVTVKDLMSGTTYYYIWYMRDSAGQTTFDAVLNFTTNKGDYRLAVNDAVAGTETYYGFIYEGQTTAGEVITEGYVQWWLPCTPSQTYRLQFNYLQEDETYEWIDVPGQSGTIPSTFSQSYVRIEGTGLKKDNSGYANAKLSAPVQIEVPAADYTYNVYFTNADGSAVTDNDRNDLVMTVNGVEQATIKGGQSGTFAQFPEGSRYRVERVYKNQPDVACEIGSGAVPEDFTGKVSTDEVLNVTYTGGDLAPEFSISRDLWVHTNDKATGTTQTPENTMTQISCADGFQGRTADYSLLFSLNDPAETISMSPFDIRSGNSRVAHNDTSWNAQNTHNDLYARYMYYSGATSDQDRTYVDFVRRDGEIARLKLVFFNSSNVSVGDYTMVRTEGSQKYTYTFKEGESIPQGAAYVTVRGCEPWSDAYNIKMHAAEIPVSGITGREFTYDLAANCLTVEISGLQFAGEEGQEIQIDEDNKVTLCVENLNESGSVLADQYSVVLTDNKTGRPMPFDGQTEDIAARGRVCLTTADPLENLDNYNLKAELLFNGSIVDEAYASNCIRPVGDTIYYTIDNTLTYEDDCALKFRTIGAAMADLKTDVNYYDTGSKNLLKHIVFKIVGGNGDYVGETDNNVSGGEVNTKVNMISEINNGTEPEGGYKVFIMRNADYKNPQVGKPVVNHVVIRNSRAVQLLFLDIQGYTKNTTSYDNAIDIDNGNGNWVQTETAGLYSNGQIEVRFCDISSMGFTCVHLSAYDNVLFEDNHITANIDPDYSNPNNQRDWGASIKFIRCSNVKFLRNTFRGQHITNMWLQECDKVLVMNNVFWTENAQPINTGGNSVAMIRMMSQTGEGTEYRALPVQNIGVYYNTFYISATNVLERADFLKFGGDAKYQNGRALEYKNVDFNYNNCYSMDADEINRSPDPLWQTQDTGNSRNIDVRYNNFWTVAESNLLEQGLQSSLSIYAIPEGTGETENNVVYNINVPAQMCSTANDNPDGLVVRGTGLNLGKTIESDISGQGAEELNNDRLYPTVGAYGVRPYQAQQGWTLGAYQQSEARQPLGTIYWFGGSDDITGQAWDLRSNWRCYDMQTKALRQVDCLDTFSDTLLVIIPAPNSTRFPVPEGGVKSYPRIPTAFDNSDDGRDENSNKAYELKEYVQAGLGMDKSVMDGKPWYFKTIYIEYGGSLLFANYLYNEDTKERHYDGASASYLAPRNVWGLTGAMIKPFVDYGSADSPHSEDVRMVKSSDYYLNLEPRVYMRYADVRQSEGQVEWTHSFPDMNVEIEPGMQFAIYLSQLYGLFGMSDNEYAEWTGKTQFIDHANTPITYNLYGRFAAEGALPYYKNLTPGEYNLLNNYLPANLSVKEILKAPNVEEVKYYVAGTNGMMGSFMDISDATVQQGDSLIYPKNGFLVKGKVLEELQITDNMVSNSHAQIYNLRNMAETYPYVSVVANNDDTPYGSQISVEVNPNVNSYNFEEFAKDKLFQGTPEMSYVPDVYIMMGEGYDEVVSVPDAETVIPLGVRVREAMDLNFYVKYIDGINEVWLEDRATGEFYPIVNYMGTIRGLEPADYQGRFYLHLSSNSEEENPDEEDNPDIDVPTDVEETTASSGIDIFNTEGAITVSSTSDIALSAVYVTDMAGRTRSYKASGNYVRIVTDLVPGVYVVNAVGDKESTERKIVVK